MASAAKPSTGEQAKGCTALVSILLIGAAACNVMSSHNAAPAPAVYTPAPIPTYTTSWAQEPVDDLDSDGIEDAFDDDVDGDGIMASEDTNDLDADTGKPKPKRKTTHEPQPKPEPEPEPEAVVNAHPGGFCGTSGATGIASNGRTYTCRGGHWRR